MAVTFISSGIGQVCPTFETLNRNFGLTILPLPTVPNASYSSKFDPFVTRLVNSAPYPPYPSSWPMTCVEGVTQVGEFVGLRLLSRLGAEANGNSYHVFVDGKNIDSPGLAFASNASAVCRRTAL